MQLRYFKDIPSEASADLKARRAKNLQINIGDKSTTDPRASHGISLLTTLGCHDLSAMRDVIGMPEKCLVATRSDDGDGQSFWWNALFQYKGFKAYFEVSPHCHWLRHGRELMTDGY
jgi:hypothetical protein